MIAVRVLAFGIVALALTGLGRADEPKKADPTATPSLVDEKKLDKNLLIGKWERTDKYVGTTMEYAKDGTYVTVGLYDPRKPLTTPGKWKLTGDKLQQTIGNYSVPPVTITKLTETEFRFMNHTGQEATYKQVAEKKKK